MMLHHLRLSDSHYAPLMKPFLHAAWTILFLSPACFAAKTVPSPEQVLADATRYTVKVQVLNDIALNRDESGARSGTGFLIDRKRGWVLTNAHVATR